MLKQGFRSLPKSWSNSMISSDRLGTVPCNSVVCYITDKDLSLSSLCRWPSLGAPFRRSGNIRGQNYGHPGTQETCT